MTPIALEDCLAEISESAANADEEKGACLLKDRVTG